MNKKIKNVLTIFTAVAVSISFSNAEDQLKTGPAVELPGFQVDGNSSLPIPLKKSIPAISSDSIGSTVVLKFTVNAKGRPTSIDTQKPLHGIYYPRDRDLAVSLMGAIKHWTFQPARDSNGQARAMKVLMPIKVVKRNGSVVALMSLTPVEGG